jgi:integrase
MCLLRPGELRQAKWADIDLDEAIWFIPAERMKMRRPHCVPLSRQVIAMLKELHEHTHWWKYLFPCLGKPRKAMSENAVNQGLRKLGYTTDEMTAHGFRAVAATLLNEMGQWNPDAIERQLAHVDTNQVRRAYARGEYWDERVEMMQHWSDYLDRLRDGGKVLRPDFKAVRATG